MSPACAANSCNTINGDAAMVANLLATKVKKALDPKGIVADADMTLTRYPFVFLVDVSYSTQMSGDIVSINKAIAYVLDQLRDPPTGSPLHKTKNQIDVCVLTYSEKVTPEVEWSTTDHLPPSLREFPADGGTYTAMGLEAAFKELADRLDYYRDPNNNINSGLGNIIHITDGAPTDMEIGDARWNSIKSHLTHVAGGSAREKLYANVIHFVAPKGCVKSPINVVRDLQGNEFTGLEAMEQLSGKELVHTIGADLQNFEKFAKVMTQLVSNISRNIRVKDAVANAVQSPEAPANGNFKPITGIKPTS
jgi:uncharacterized protein YegL